MDFEVGLVRSSGILVFPNALPYLENNSRNCTSVRSEYRILRSRDFSTDQAFGNVRKRTHLGTYEKGILSVPIAFIVGIDSENSVASRLRDLRENILCIELLPLRS